MRREVLRAKLHRAAVTRCDLDYEGSVTLDRDLLEQLGAWPYEAVEVYDIDNGERFRTYFIPGERGSKELCINGAAARLVEVGHRVILACYGIVDGDAPPAEPPIVVVTNEHNEVQQVIRDPGTE
ncbi:MAG: aspartate 1-decarboxylase [Planctomycetota bacterium]